MRKEIAATVNALLNSRLDILSKSALIIALHNLRKATYQKRAHRGVTIRSAAMWAERGEKKSA